MTICKTTKQVIKISNEIFKGKFKSSKKLVLEEFLEGEEASYFMIVDKNSFKFLVRRKIISVSMKMTKDPILGNGCLSPAPIITSKLEKKIISKIVKPTILGS